MLLTLVLQQNLQQVCQRSNAGGQFPFGRGCRRGLTAYRQALGDRVEKRDLGCAIELFEAAIAADARFSPAYKKLGYSLWRLGSAEESAARLGEALKRLEEYQRLEPQKAEREGVVEAMDELRAALGSGA